MLSTSTVVVIVGTIDPSQAGSLFPDNSPVLQYVSVSLPQFPQCTPSNPRVSQRAPSLVPEASKYATQQEGSESIPELVVQSLRVGIPAAPRSPDLGHFVRTTIADVDVLTQPVIADVVGVAGGALADNRLHLGSYFYAPINTRLHTRYLGPLSLMKFRVMRDRRLSPFPITRRRCGRSVKPRCYPRTSPIFNRVAVAVARPNPLSPPNPLRHTDCLGMCASLQAPLAGQTGNANAESIRTCISRDVIESLDGLVLSRLGREQGDRGAHLKL